MLKVLVACEESQRVCTAFRELGHEAYSCDIVKPSGEHSEWHILGDVLKVLNPSDHLGDFEAPDRYISFKTMDGCYHEVRQWDIIIAFPPCTHLAVSGARHFEKKRTDGRQKEGIELFCIILNANCDRICVENPVNIMDVEHIADMEEALKGFIVDILPEDEPIKYKAKLENLITGIVIEKSN